MTPKPKSIVFRDWEIRALRSVAKTMFRVPIRGVPDDCNTFVVAGDGTGDVKFGEDIGPCVLMKGEWTKMPFRPGDRVAVKEARTGPTVTEIEVLSTRVERLNDMDNTDLWAEGGQPELVPEDTDNAWSDFANRYELPFKRNWKSRHGKRYPASGNPWVLAVTFKRIEVNP